MKVFWHDNVRGVGLTSSKAKPADLDEAERIWFDEIRGVKGSFFGLIDDTGKTIQFNFEEGIPEHVNDASILKIISADFPHPAKQGSYSKKITIGEAWQWIERAYQVGADPDRFEGLSFIPW